MGIKTICLQEAAHLVRRGPKYWIVVSHMYLNGLTNPMRAKIFRAAYFFCRHIDDVLDGDRKISSDPEEYVNSILKGMNEKINTPKIVNLYHFVIDHIKTNGTSNPQKDFRNIINVMLYDYKRSKDKQILTKKELDNYFSKTFTPVLNISLQIGNSKLRGKDLLDMAYAMGHLYSIRDMKIDLSRRIINIPKEELILSELTGLISYDKVCKNTHLSKWMNLEVDKYHKILFTLKEKLKNKNDKNSIKICAPLIRSMESYCRKYFKIRRKNLSNHINL